jgi:hypothetical protein
MHNIAGNLSHAISNDKAFSMNYYIGNNTFNDFGESIFNLAAEKCS